MNERSANEQLITIIEQIYHARHEIAVAYDNKGSQFNDDDAEKLNPLVKSYLMKKTGDGVFSLRQKFRELFDLPLGRDNIASFNSNLHEWVKRIEINIQRLSEVSLYLPEDRPRILNEIQENVSDIRDTLEDAVDKLYFKTESSFGTLSTSQSKLEENRFYIEKIATLLESYDEVNKLLSSESFRDDPDVEEILVALPVHCVPIINKLTVINAKLREFMFKQRIIEKQAVKIKALINHINNYPGFRPDNAYDKSSELIQMTIVEPLKIKLMPDLYDANSEEILVPIINDIQAKLKTDNLSKTELKASTLNPEKERTESIEPEPIDAFVEAMLVESFQSHTPVSTISYWAENVRSNDRSISIQEFCFETINFINDNPKYDGKPLSNFVKRHLLLKDVPDFTGNKLLCDIYIYPAKMPKKEALLVLETA